MSIKELVDVVAKLRGPDGCPWDKAQTPSSLTRYILEEAFELVEAIDSGVSSDVREELGDYLFQVVLQAQIFSERGEFDFEEVVSAVTTKMIRRHPHVFSAEGGAAESGSRLGSPEQVVAKWEEIKKAEKKPGTHDKIMEPFRMPALLAALKIGERSVKWKFDWDTREQVFAKVEEEIAEIYEVLDERTDSAEDSRKAELEEEFGDFLFASAQWARHLDIDPEQALRRANQKFQKRFATMIGESGLDQASFAALSLDEKEELWDRAKKKLRLEK